MRGRRGATEAAGLVGAAVDRDPADTSVEFRPRRGRWVAAQMLGCAVVCCIYGVGRAILTNPVDWLFYVIFCGAFLFLIPASRNQSGWFAQAGAVRVSGIEVKGPAGSWLVWRPFRETIALTELDRVRSARRSTMRRLVGRQYLYSTTGKRIRIQRWMFDPEDLREMLAAIAVGKRPLMRHESRDR